MERTHMGQGTSNVTVKDLEMDADSLDPLRAAAIYQEHGALVVRGLMREHVEAVRRDIMASVDKAMSLYDRAEKIPEGWLTPDGTLWLPAPEGFERDRQVMVSSCRYCNSAALFHSAFEPKLVSLTTAILGPNVELYLDGQCLVKEPVGGHAKHLHQDAGYFEHKYEGPVGALSYAVDTDVKRGALHVVPGSHRMD
ncbi:MAG: phytanoyl-CoA dioxygenase family protein, partial [Phycisphaeraceae bacterium]